MNKFNKHIERLDSIRDEEDYTQSTKLSYLQYAHWNPKMRDESCNYNGTQNEAIIGIAISGLTWVMHSTKNAPISELEKKFNEFSKKWKDETGLFSTTYQKIVNDLYFDIVALGNAIVPFILKDLQNNGPAHWHTALKALTQENPIKDEDSVTNKQIKEAWIQWGKSKNLIQ